MTDLSSTAIVAVTYRKVDYARIVLSNVYGCMDSGIKLFVVDNDSGPEMLDLLATLSALGKDRIDVTGCRKNIGKANAVNLLIEEKKLLDRFDHLVLMDQDIIFTAADLRLLLDCLKDIDTPGMISMDYYSWNSPKPPNGKSISVHGKSGKSYQFTVSSEDPSTRARGFVGGGVFGITSDTVKYCLNGRLYPDTPYIYYTEDTSLDLALARQGRVNGYLKGTLAIHLPELDQSYYAWKNTVRQMKEPPVEGYFESGLK